MFKPLDIVMVTSIQSNSYCVLSHDNSLSVSLQDLSVFTMPFLEGDPGRAERDGSRKVKPLFTFSAHVIWLIVTLNWRRDRMYKHQPTFQQFKTSKTPKCNINCSCKDKNKLMEKEVKRRSRRSDMMQELSETQSTEINRSVNFIWSAVSLYSMTPMQLKGRDKIPLIWLRDIFVCLELVTSQNSNKTKFGNVSFSESCWDDCFCDITDPDQTRIIPTS